MPFKFSKFKSLSVCCLMVTLLTMSAVAQQTDKKLISPEDYDQWQELRYFQLAENADWITYQIQTVEGDHSTHLYNLKTGTTKVYENASRGALSKGKSYLSYRSVPTGAEAKKLAKAKKKDKSKKETEADPLILVNLASMDSLQFKNVDKYDFSHTSNFLALKHVKSKDHTLIIKNLNTNEGITFGNVKDFKWQDEGDLIALLIDSEDKVGNAIQLFNPVTGTLKVLDQTDSSYDALSWAKDANHLIARRVQKDKAYTDDSYDILVWKDVMTKNERKYTFESDKFKNFPQDMRILSDAMTWSTDGNKVFFKLFHRTKDDNAAKKDGKEKSSADSTKVAANKKSGADDYEAPEVEIWNSSDAVIIPAQKKKQLKHSQQATTAVWILAKNQFTVLTDDLVETVVISKDANTLLGTDNTPYEFESQFGRPNYDIYQVDISTGAKKKLVEGVRTNLGLSPDENFFVYVKDNQLMLFNIKTMSSTSLTAGINEDFVQLDSDHPLPQQPPYGMSKWSEDSKTFLAYSKYDVWQFFVDGKDPIKLTNGSAEHIQYRPIAFDWNETFLDISQPIYYSMEGELSKEMGYAKAKLGKPIKTLIYEPQKFTRLTKADNANKLAYIKQSFDQSPNVFIADSDFNSEQRISNTNDFQKNYLWTKAELVSYQNARGLEAQGILYYPADYKEGVKYPMITYVYEKLSHGFHSYNLPSHSDYYNTTVWTQNGYFVLKPDIEFNPGDPGISSTETLENAVAAVVKKGAVDAKKVGLIGHSWGGYQAGYVPTQTDIFAASVAGAGLTNLISMNLAVTPAFGGQPENNHFEVGQERMGSAPWVSPDNYVRNSSVMQIDKLNTPILFEVGDNDMNVNWTQGIEYYNAARRANKPFVLLVYAKEGHGLREEKNKKDYQQRILKWFGHYLKGDEAEDWILEGVPYAEQQKRLKNPE